MIYLQNKCQKMNKGGMKSKRLRGRALFLPQVNSLSRCNRR